MIADCGLKGETAQPSPQRATAGAVPLARENAEHARLGGLAAGRGRRAEKGGNGGTAKRRKRHSLQRSGPRPEPHPGQGGRSPLAGQARRGLTAAREIAEGNWGGQKTRKPEMEDPGRRPDLKPQASSLKPEFSSLPLKPVPGISSEKVACPLFPPFSPVADSG